MVIVETGVFLGFGVTGVIVTVGAVTSTTSVPLALGALTFPALSVIVAETV
jgi:hypothetical protein